MIKWDLSQKCKVSSTYENQPVIQHINGLKKKNRMIILIDPKSI